ncbi:Galactokinase (GalK) [Mycobacteroides abscessus subsp. bolletii]|uniref:galactokinase n=1 Tax=Mycobacteroides abscessus TaxID=36809 RepID=UPI0009A6AA9F|nr:galactokinase [Mycobacteroides abscessus]SKF82156.1 Galactokinase (GalK) [Mycobacteroides abscessus subsp. bolletii]SKF84081.1 Galactokinase (GalK) [Mycobacteroides abscessus subsp. bolletii]
MTGTWSAPGRVNVIGEHTDYNGGLSLPIAIPQHVDCTLTPRDDETVRVASQQHGRDWVEVPLDRLADTDIVSWARYPLGVVHEFVKRGNDIHGMDLRLDGDVPVGAGLSSSAAVECAVAAAIRDTFATELSDSELVDITHRAENDFVGAPTGLLDQSASILCTAGHALFLDAATGAHTQVPFDLAAAGLELVVIDTGTRHNHVTSEYATRRQQCQTAASLLEVHSLGAVIDAGVLDTVADPMLRARARHVVTENARVREVVAILQSGRDPRSIGPILTRGHGSLRDDFAVSTPQLDAAVEASCDSGAHGARMTGGGFGGSVIALGEADSSVRIGTAVTQHFSARDWPTPQVFVVTPSEGARRIR